ncbi:hypothetical protein NC651_015720 [Populus alba x Populus x berolinensis]|nr:hypothetical protein NC651_015720 [Populus alba x Populus x berolinensis]
MDIALFSPSSLFADDDDFSSEETKDTQQNHVERRHSFPGMLHGLKGKEIQELCKGLELNENKFEESINLKKYQFEEFVKEAELEREKIMEQYRELESKKEFEKWYREIGLKDKKFDDALVKIDPTDNHMVQNAIDLSDANLCSYHLKKGDLEFEASVVIRSCILLLEQLMKISPEIRPRQKKKQWKLPLIGELLIREFSFHKLNANLLWPGTFAFAEWLVQNRPLVEGRHCIELGSGTGALAIFLRKSFHLDITTSDYNDQEIEENIAHNCRVNGVTPVLPHIRHSWGDTFPAADPDWDLVIANVKQYPNLIKTLSFLLKSYKLKNDRAGSIMENEQNGGTHNIGLPRPAFLMSWRRRIGKEDESLFFDGCESAGLRVEHLGSRVYCITPKDQVSGYQIELTR